MNIGGRIRFYRRLKGCSQGELATRLGMAAPQLSRYERGRTQPGTRVLSRIARGLGVPVSDFFF
jgi:transcriptional regulator with XRE-family HTH domain